MLFAYMPICVEIYDQISTGKPADSDNYFSAIYQVHYRVF
jgi:hypothetical protein